MSELVPGEHRLLDDLRRLIDEGRYRVAAALNSELVTLYWRVGRRIYADILQEQRAGYGEAVVGQLAERLSADYGRGFTKRNLHNLVRFAEAFPDAEKVHALRAQLSWTHFRELIAIDDGLKRDFYTEMCRLERWSTRTLTAKSRACFSSERQSLANRSIWRSKSWQP